MQPQPALPLPFIPRLTPHIAHRRPGWSSSRKKQLLSPNTIHCLVRCPLPTRIAGYTASFSGMHGRHRQSIAQPRRSRYPQRPPTRGADRRSAFLILPLVAWQPRNTWGSRATREERLNGSVPQDASVVPCKPAEAPQSWAHAGSMWMWAWACVRRQPLFAGSHPTRWADQLRSVTSSYPDGPADLLYAAGEALASAPRRGVVCN